MTRRYSNPRRRARFKQLKESVVLSKFVSGLRHQGLITANGLVWGDPRGTALAEVAAHHSQVVLRKIWAVECNLGHGSSLLASLCESADTVGVSMRLEVRTFRLSFLSTFFRRGKPDPNWTPGQLQDWYAKFPYLQVRRGRRPGGLNRKQLFRWYERFGFERTGYGNLMIRKLRSEEPGTCKTPIPAARQPASDTVRLRVASG